MKLTTNQLNLVRLYQRSNKDADGWTTVSKTVWPLMADLPTDLFDKEGTEESGGRIRLNENGAVVVPYL